MLALAAQASAAEEDLRGFYLGAGIGNATLELEDSESTADFKGDDTGYKVIAGYRILDWLAVEANYAQYGEPSDRVLGVELEGDFTAFSASAVAMLPLQSVDLFGRAGIAAWDGTLRSVQFGVSASEDNVDPLFGLGAQLRFGAFALRAEWEALLLSFDDDDDDESDGDDWVDMLSVGFTYRF
jgi:hypothetical protein